MGNTEKTIVAFLAGAIAGALTGVLLAPESGRRTRKKINKAASDFVYDVEDSWESSADRVKEASDTAVSELEKYTKKVSEVVNSTKK
jgi:gas vesicle protein